jgi:predicted aspartyl protease
MIDTGSSISVINREIVNKYKLKSPKYQKIRISNAVSSLNITTDEVIKCNIKIQNMELVNKTINIVDELQTALILSIDFLRNLTIQLTHKPSIKIQCQVNHQIEVETHSLNHVVVNKENDIYEINQGKDEINVG